MSDITWTTETRKLKDLIANKDNPRRLSKRQGAELKTSLSKFGVCQPIVIQQNNYIIGGHQRVKTLKSLGHKEVEVKVASRELTNAEEKELSIRLNKNIGEWDFDALANVWEIDDLVDWGFDVREFGMDEIEMPKDLIDEEKAKPFSIKITFGTIADFNKAHIEIKEITSKYKNAVCSVSGGEL